MELKSRAAKGLYQPHTPRGRRARPRHGGGVFLPVYLTRTANHGRTARKPNAKQGDGVEKIAVGAPCLSFWPSAFSPSVAAHPSLQSSQTSALGFAFRSGCLPASRLAQIMIVKRDNRGGERLPFCIVQSIFFE